LVTAQIVALQLAQALPQLLQAAAPHGAFLGHTVSAASQDIDFALTLQELDVNLVPYLFPWLYPILGFFWILTLVQT
jgi:hypothetical protein